MDVVWAVIALAFLVEFIARSVVARATWPFLRAHGWELALVALPFLRFMRALRAGRGARGLASAVRSSCRAAEKLRSRLTWLLLVTVVDAAMSTVTGSSLGQAHAFPEVLEVILAVCSAVIIATIAGSLGAYFSEARTDVPAKPAGPWWEAEREGSLAPRAPDRQS